jgi:hypothetical protein
VVLRTTSTIASSGVTSSSRQQDQTEHPSGPHDKNGRVRNANLLRDVSALSLLRKRAWTGAPFFGVYLAGSHSLHPRLWRSRHLALSRRSLMTRQQIISHLRISMALRPITCGVAAGVDGGAVGAIGPGAAGGMRGVTAAPATANAAAARLAAPLLQRHLPHGPGLIRFQRPPAARKSSFDDGAYRRALSGCGSLPCACASLHGPDCAGEMNF